eukprot:TRINITY_DN3875_c0_g1_i1.p1 TRINITY_DN3875_c0_g1~~TRINITY_DN3875_c0_g1_i1.p1  ORF type:complete len:439 (+),score=181.33 TRINITY_DN3875_c0_g1_i1:115-1317(+)
MADEDSPVPGAGADDAAEAADLRRQIAEAAERVRQREEAAERRRKASELQRRISQLETEKAETVARMHRRREDDAQIARAAAAIAKPPAHKALGVQSAEEVVLTEQQSIVRQREHEAAVISKQIRELDIILRMKKQRAADLEAEATRQIEAAESEKDQHICGLVRRCMKERETLLADLQEVRDHRQDALQQFQDGSVEDHHEKGKRLTHHHRIHEDGLHIHDGQEKRAGEREKTKVVSMRCTRPRPADPRDDAPSEPHKRITWREKSQQRVAELEQAVEDDKMKLKEKREAGAMIARSTKHKERAISAEMKEMQAELADLRRKLGREKDDQLAKEQLSQQVFTSLVAEEAKVNKLQHQLEQLGKDAKDFRLQCRTDAIQTAAAPPALDQGPTLAITDITP